jgi:hypothetical protein
MLDREGLWVLGRPTGEVVKVTRVRDGGEDGAAGDDFRGK